MDKRNTFANDPVDGVLVKTDFTISNLIKQRNVEGTVDSLDQSFNRLDSFVLQIQEISDRVNGPRPSPAIEGKEAAPPTNSLLHLVRSKCDRVHKIADLMEREIKGLRDGLWGNE